MSTSLEHRLAALSPAERDSVLEGLDLTRLAYSWQYCARPEQWRATRSTSHVVLFGAGRGAGKTRNGSEWIRDKIDRNPLGRPLRFGLVGRTAADVRDVMINGASGLMAVFPPHQRPRYVPSHRRVEFHDGSVALMFSAEEPDQLRGPSFDFTWCDELAAWDHRPDDSGLTAWDNAKIATRDGTSPQLFVTTTPKRSGPLPELYRLAGSGLGVELITASTYDNPHLSPEYMETIRGLYEGTRLGQQELYAMLLEDVEGAMWLQADLDRYRVPADSVGTLPLRVVAVDPSVAENPRDECGIVVVGATNQPNPVHRTGYVLADRSVWGSPAVWAQRVVDTARMYEAPVVAEVNNGGALVAEAIKAIDPTVRVTSVTAKKNKRLRAEPVQMAYEQHRVHHAGNHPLLEAQMTSWVPGETTKSPDRVDAMVYAVASLLIPSSSSVGIGPVRVSRAKGHLPTARRQPLGAGARTW